MKILGLCKDQWDVLLGGITILGAAVAFWFGLHQWRRGQAWQRADKLDDFITKFESDDLLRLGATVLDWSKRMTTYQGHQFLLLNEDALLALRDHATITERPMFPGGQAQLRDAYDALLAFFQRLELSIANGLIEADSTKAYFAYWLERLLKFDRHPDKHGVLKGVSPEAMVAGYIKLYGDPESIKRLCRCFKLKHNL